MAVSRVQISPADVAVDVSNTGRTVTLPANATAGNCIVLFVSGWNFAETGEVVSGVTDDGGNTYTRIGNPSIGAHGRMEVWAAVNVSAADVVTYTPAVANGSNRMTAFAAEYGGVDANPIDASAIGTGGLSSTGFTAPVSGTAAPSTDDQMLIAALCTMWPDTPKGHSVSSPTGMTTVYSKADTSSPANSMGLLVSEKLVTSTAGISVTWAYNSQSQGAQGLWVTLKAGASTGYRVRVSGKDPQAIGASSCLVEIYKAPVDPSIRILGEYIHTETGYTIVDDGTGSAGVLIDLPGTPDVIVGESVLVTIRGLTGGQSWGCHRWVGTVEAIPA